jgi:hypothetical protein
MKKIISTMAIVVSLLAFPWSETIDVEAQTTTIAQKAQSLPIKARFLLKGQEIQLEVAETSQQQQIGLMYRTSLPANRGMLFSFKPPRPVGFWMKNTLIPLDIIFLKDGKIQAIFNQVPPCKKDPCHVYGTESPIDMAIELRAGRSRELGLRQGDLLKIESIAPKN